MLIGLFFGSSFIGGVEWFGKIHSHRQAAILLYNGYVNVGLVFLFRARFILYCVRINVQLKANHMKRIILSIVGSMLISLCAVQAQERDTTGMASKSRNKQNKQRYEQSQQQRDQTRQQQDQTRRQQDQTRQQQDQAWQQQGDKSRNAYANEGMVIIEKNEIPASLKQTLQKEKYAGWENATIYHNTNTGEYVIAPRAYRFDEQGKEMPMGNAAYGSRDGQSRYSQDQAQGQNMQQPPERTSQSQQGQDARDETSTYSSRDQSENNRQYQGNESSQTKRNQTLKTQPQSYDQTSGNQQRTNDQSTTNDESPQNQEERADQSSQSQDESSSAYRRDQSQQTQRDGQQPSSSYRSGQDDQSNRSGQNQPGQSGENQYRTEDMTEVQPGEAPASLRRTLSESKYSGWEESGKLYRDPSTNEYVLVMEKSDDSSQPRAYRFDRNGQLKEDQNETGDQSESQGQNGSSRRNNGQ
jgi:chromatin modification-related protein VID21